jgi:ribosomal protein L15
VSAKDLWMAYQRPIHRRVPQRGMRPPRRAHRRSFLPRCRL